MSVEGLVALIGMLAVLALVWVIFSIVGDMARDRGHSPWPWWIVSLCWSPFGSMIVLWLFFDVVDQGEDVEDQG